MNSLKDFWSRIAAKKTETNAYFQIKDDRVVDTHTPHSAVEFVPGETYFEVRLKQMFLQNSREYFREFVPVASVFTEFQFAGKRAQVPTVVGPSLLANVEKVSKGDRIEFLNTRLVGPCPYEGEDLTLFVGLFRMVTTDWSKRALNLLETFAKTFDSSQLSSFIGVSESLADGLQGFCGMKDLEVRLGHYVQYTTPDVICRDEVGTLRPSFNVYMRRPSSQLTPDEQRKFWVKEGRLFYGDDEQDLKEFIDVDFVLVQMVPLTARQDYTTFNFHRKHWKKIEGLLAEQKNDDALVTFKLLASDLVQCEDITRKHRFLLLKGYRQKMDDDIEYYKNLYSSEKKKGFGMRGPSAQVAGELDEAALLTTVEAKTEVKDFSRERLFNEFAQ